MKIQFVVIPFLFFALTAYSQSVRYSRIELPFAVESLEKITGCGLPVTDVREGNYIRIELSDDELALVEGLGLKYRLLIDDLENYYAQRNAGKEAVRILEYQRNSGKYNIPEEFTLGSMGGFSTLDEIISHLDNMRMHYPQLVSEKEAVPGGESIEGRPIYWVRISSMPDTLQLKPRVLYSALTHAREPASMQQMLFFMYYILENYDVDPEIKSLVDHTEMYFIPVVNPDGYVYNQTAHPAGGGMWRKNRRNNGDGSAGVDLNRNFGYKWGYNNLGSSPYPSSNTYRGAAPFSEPETQLLKTFCETYNFDVALNIHSYGNMLLYPWGYVSNMLVPDHKVFQEFSYLMTKENHYLTGQPGALIYTVNGDFNDWLYGETTTKMQCIAFSPELGSAEDGFWPPLERIIPQCEELLYQNIMAAKLTGFYCEFYDLSPINISSQCSWLSYGIRRTGLADLPFTIAFNPVSDSFISTLASKTYTGSNHMTIEIDSVEYILKPGLRIGDEISIAITVTSQGFTLNDTLTKVFGAGKTLMFDSCNYLNQWLSSDWNLSAIRAYSPNYSIASSPSGSYPNNSESAIITLQSIDLTDTQMSWLSYNAYWDLSGGEDYVRLMASVDNGQTWAALRGRLMSDHVVPENPEILAYRGKHDGWLRDWVSLDAFYGDSLMIGFWLKTDEAIGREGFYFDDFKIEKLDDEIFTSNIEITNGWNDLSGWVVPLYDSLEVIFACNAADLQLLKNQTGSYQPGSPSNDLTRWVETDGYLLKAANNFTLQLTGNRAITRVLELDSGWNLIPVISDKAVPVTKLFTVPSDCIEIVREAIGDKAFWPYLNVHTLDSLAPNRAYLIKLNQPALLFFGGQ